MACSIRLTFPLRLSIRVDRSFWREKGAIHPSRFSFMSYTKVISFNSLKELSWLLESIFV